MRLLYWYLLEEDFFKFRLLQYNNWSQEFNGMGYKRTRFAPVYPPDIIPCDIPFSLA